MGFNYQRQTMHKPLSHIAIIVRKDHPEAEQSGRDIAAWLAQAGVKATLREHEPEKDDLRDVAPLPDLVLVLGGDGTFISAARETLHREIPLLGVNQGKVGFLTAVEQRQWQTVLQDILDGQFSVEERTVLEYTLERDGQPIRCGLAINDVAVSRGMVARLVRLAVELDGERRGDLRSDGLVIATPTGSTAYSISAGGPVIHPRIDAFCITPICPFRNYFNPLVVPSDASLAVINEDKAGEVILTEDGQRAFPMQEGDRITFRCARYPLRLLVPNGASFFSTLVTKGFLTER
ncbi:MAG: NAD(+)/NADH kinase [Desulfovibrio sp.]|uniref:NAD(+)/NADH kinase n=1 Tax=Desulfovibrio sp. 7SRBS1 TaxID=3378064 RepID=UPI003B3FC53C